MSTVDALPPFTSQAAARTKASLSIVVPVSERPAPLDEIYESYAPTLFSMALPFEFIFVITSWGRRLVAPLEELVAEGAPIRVLEVGPRAGESGMLVAAASRAEGDFLVTIPPYLRVAPESIAALVERITSGEVDMVTACRSREGDSWFNRLQSRTFHALLGAAIGRGFRDVASGVRAFPAQLLQEVTLYGDFFRFLPILARNEGWRVEEIEVPQHPADRRSRVYSAGVYVRRLLDILAVYFLARFTHKPLRFFGLLGSMLSVTGGVLFVIIAVQRFLGEAISDRPLLLLAVLLFVLGIQAIAIGLIGEIIVHFGASRTRLYRVRETRVAPQTESTPKP